MMAEAPLILKPPTLKKRKNDVNHKVGVGGSKKQILISDVDRGNSVSKDNTVAANMSEVRKTYHIGGTKYLIFHGSNGLIENIYFKDWDGKKVNSSVALNISKFVMVLHSSDVITVNLDKVCAGEKDISQKIHIGENFYLTCTSPYKLVQIRKWKKNKDDEMFPTKEGISLKGKEWREMVKFSNEMYSERLELFQYVPCLLDPTLSDHDSLTCRECSVNNLDARGLVNMIIPL